MTVATLVPLDLMSTHDHQELLDISVPLPRWLNTAGQDVRDEYVEQLSAYHQCAHRLEAHLSDALPSFDEYVQEQLAKRIKSDFSTDLDPDVLVVDLPLHVWRAYELNPQFGGVKSYSPPWAAGTAREQLSLSEMARRNFRADDQEMAARLSFASISQDGSSLPDGLNGAWLQRVVPELDVAQGYRKKLDATFTLPSMSSAQGQREASLLLDPYERLIQLQGFCEFARNRLSKQGHWMLRLAAQARSRSETDAAGLEMNWVELKPGTSVSGESSGHTLSGVCVIRDRATDRVLMYLSDAPSDIAFIEGDNPAQVRSRLIQWMYLKPALIDYLAERTLDTENVARHASYINQALARNFSGFIRFVPAIDLQPAAQQLQRRARLLHLKTQERAQSQFDLAVQRNREQNESFLAYFRALLSLLPGIGTLISLQEGWASGHEAAKAFSEGKLDDGLLAAGGVAVSVLDVVLSAVPGVLGMRLLTRMARSGVVTRAASSPARSYVLKPFEGYEVRVSLAGAVPQNGRDAGTLLKDGTLWIERENQVYAVYRRSGEQTSRLKKTSVRGYEPAVRFEDGRWVYHNDVGLKGGVRSTIAETLIVKARNDPAFKNRHARELLDQYLFPADQQRRLELDIAVHYEKHQEFPAWAQTYRKAQPATDATPVPGSSGVKRKPSASGDSQAKRTPATAATSSATTVSGPDGWKAWARTLDSTQDVRQVEVSPPIFQLASDEASRFIQIDGARYDILPSGASQHPSMVLLKNPAMLDDTFSVLNETIRRNRFEQPIMAAFENGQWTVHGPLFKHKIQVLVEQARPGMTPATNRVLAEKLYDGADSAHGTMTAWRLINMRATLNAWQKGSAAPLVGLNDPLLMLEGARLERIDTLAPCVKISYGPSLQSFRRLDFVVEDPALVSLRNAAIADAGVTQLTKTSMRELMTRLLTRQGYTMVSADEVVLSNRSILLFRRTGQEQLYILNTRRSVGATVDFQVRTIGSAAPLSNRWIDEWLAAHPQEAALTLIVQARDEGRLVKLVGGVRVRSSAAAATQVFVQRLAADF